MNSKNNKEQPPAGQDWGYYRPKQEGKPNLPRQENPKQNIPQSPPIRTAKQTLGQNLRQSGNGLSQNGSSDAPLEPPQTFRPPHKPRSPAALGHPKKGPQKRSSLMRSSLKGLRLFLGGVLGLAGLGFALLSLQNPSGILRDKIIAEVKSKTGRDLVVSGPTSFTLYPSLGYTLKNVTLSAPPGFLGSHFLTLKGLTVSLELLPLLNQQVRIDQVVLTEPNFHIEIDKTGRRSWDFAEGISEEKAQQRVPIRAAPVPEDLPSTQPLDSPLPQIEEPSQLPLFNLEKVSLGAVRIDQGTLSYKDQRTGKTLILKDLNLDLSVPKMTGPAQLSGQLSWQGETFNFFSEVTSLHTLLMSAPSHLKAQITGRLLTGLFDGTLTSKLHLETKGTLEIQAPSLKNLLAFTQGEPLKKENADVLSLSGKVSAFKTVIALTAATFSSPAFEGKGEFSLTTSQDRPFIKAQLDLSHLDVSELLSTAEARPPQTNNPKDKDVTGRKHNATRLKFASQLSSLGGEDASGWSEQPYNFKALANADIEATLSAEKGVFKSIKFGKSQFLLSLKNRILETKFSQVELYDGSANGAVSLNALDPKNPEIVSNIEITNLQIQPLLKDAARTDWFIGKGTAKINITGKGPNEKTLINSLSGSADLRFEDGAIVGLNIAGLIRNTSQGSLAGLKTAPSEKTDFSELSSTWSIEGGIAHNEDFQLLSPLLRVSGSGKVFLQERTLEYVLRPKMVSDIAGQGGKVAPTGLEIPIRVQGSWDKPKYSPDLKGILENPNKAVETIKEIGKQFKGKNAADILKGLLGRANSSSQSSKSPSPPHSAETNPSNEAASAPKTSKTGQFLKSQ